MNWMATKCPVCNRFRHTHDCPVRETMALEWSGKSPDERAQEVHRREDSA